MEQVHQINVGVLFNNTIAVGVLKKYPSKILILVDNEEICLDNDTIIGGYSDVGSDKIQLKHLTKGKVLLKFLNTLYRDGAINLLRQIFRDVSSDSGISDT
ncbi:hypothetical protein Trydic_g23257 [Trypoxylus dichotomus]